MFISGFGLYFFFSVGVGELSFIFGDLGTSFVFIFSCLVWVIEFRRYFEGLVGGG